MNKIVWILVVTYVGLAAGLFYSLAIEAPDLFLLLAALLLALAVPQRLLLSRTGHGGRTVSTPKRR